jgi:hypothetical protein
LNVLFHTPDACSVTSAPDAAGGVPSVGAPLPLRRLNHRARFKRKQRIAEAWQRQPTCAACGITTTIEIRSRRPRLNDATLSPRGRLLCWACEARGIDSDVAVTPGTVSKAGPVEASVAVISKTGTVRLPDGRVVRSDNLSGAALTLPEAMVRTINKSPPRPQSADAGGGGGDPSDLCRFGLTGREPSPGKSATTLRHERLEALVEKDPDCPSCGRALVIPVPGWRMTDSATATIDPQGRAVCARCRSTQSVRAAAEATANRMAKLSPVPGPLVSFFRG